MTGGAFAALEARWLPVVGFAPADAREPTVSATDGRPRVTALMGATTLRSGGVQAILRSMRGSGFSGRVALVLTALASLAPLVLASGCGLLLGDGLDVRLAGQPVDGSAAEEIPPPTAPNPDGSCEAERKNCAGVCVSLRDPAFGCAAEACEPCSVTRGTATCTAGSCAVAACEQTYADCDSTAADGCETNTSSSPSHCGACGTACEGGQVCSLGACSSSCAGGLTACAGACVDLSADPANCGACGNTCPVPANGSSTCAASQCGTACPTGRVLVSGECVLATSFDDRRTLSVGGYGGAYACGIKPTGELACWGSTTLTSVPAGSYVAVDVNVFGCAVKSGGSLACWGASLGTATALTPPAGTFVSIGTGDAFACAIRSDGNIACWGSNADGRATPPSGSFATLSVGSATACAVRTDGALLCWGSDSTQLVSTRPAGTFRAVTVDDDRACAIRSDGTVKCWGDANSPSGTFQNISTGWDHACGIRQTGTTSCWGTGDVEQTSVPSGAFRAVVAGYRASCGARADGTVECWGDIVEPPFGFAVK